MQVIAFYTANTPYEREINTLVESAEALDLNIIVKPYAPRGNWTKNCGIKPEFILEMMQSFPEEDLLYVDSDAIFKSYPKIFDNMPADIAVHYRPHRELLSGTIYLKNNDNMKELIYAWIKEQTSHEGEWDQRTLSRVIDITRKRLDFPVYQLPPEYCFIDGITKCEEKPIIFHTQSSRRHKDAVNTDLAIKNPVNIAGFKARMCPDGSFFIPRARGPLVKMLDEQYVRLPNELRWMPRSFTSDSVDSLKSVFDGKQCYIVGKGPSLDKLTASDFGDDPIIAINEAIHKVESLELDNHIYVIQQDAALRNTCLPKNGSILVSVQARHWYAEQDDKIIYNAPELGLNYSSLSASCAIKLAIAGGCTDIHMLCFDACLEGILGYAECIGYDPSEGGDPARFNKHREELEKVAEDHNLIWFKVNPSESSSDKPQPSQHNPIERHEPEDSPHDGHLLASLD